MSIQQSRAYAKELVESLQQRFVQKLENVSEAVNCKQKFIPIEWSRDEGRHGGGIRYSSADNKLFNRASVNISQVHYDDMPEKNLDSATAISTIIHPYNPKAPSMHMHISWTQLKSGQGYWRMMADLNPSIPNPDETQQFTNNLKNIAAEQYEQAAQQGDRYFYIPALDRHRGVSHFYLESYNSGDEQADQQLAKQLGESVIDTYCDILQSAILNNPNPSATDFDAQQAYHTLYFLQVLTLDRGTTSGLLVHNQNDIGTLGSIPSHVDRSLLNSWIVKHKTPQDELLKNLITALPEQSPCLINDGTKQDLANEVRKFYQAHPEAIDMQASGNTIPPTVANHR